MSQPDPPPPPPLQTPPTPPSPPSNTWLTVAADKERCQKGTAIGIFLIEDGWQEIFEWLDAQLVMAKGVPYTSTAQRFLPRFDIAEQGCPPMSIWFQSPSPLAVWYNTTPISLCTAPQCTTLFVL